MTKDTVTVTIRIDKSLKDKVIERFGEGYIIACLPAGTSIHLNK